MKLIASILLALFTSSASALQRRMNGDVVLRATPTTQTGVDLLVDLPSSFPELDFWREPSYAGNPV
jgi:hypothetical protein